MKQEGKDILVIEDNTIYEIDWECMHNQNVDCGKQGEVWEEKPVEPATGFEQNNQNATCFSELG